MSSGGVRPGLEVLLGEHRELLTGTRVALLAHAASVDRELRHAGALLAARDDLKLVRLFGPEHGLHGSAQDMEPVSDGEGALRGVELVSLYGASEESLRPPPGSLDDVDVVLVDLQDIGARYYTYTATAAHLAEACARASVRMVVADRPNPLGGVLIEGEGVEPEYRSFVSRFDLPARHGLTLGELLLWARAREDWNLDLRVVPAEGWRRSQEQETTGLPWVMPSPNMPSPDTARVYPGLCLVEGTNLSEGRGTTRPFELVGAPFIQAGALAARLEAEELAGVRFRPCVFRPTSGKWQGEDCGGVQLHITDPAALRPVRTGLAVVAAARALAPGGFRWREEPYEFVSDRLAFDLLAGSNRWRRALEQGRGVAEIARSWAARERSWLEERREALLYPE